MTTTNTQSNFHIFLEDRCIPNPDEMLGRALQYLKKQGKQVILKGFNQNQTPVIDIDGKLYLFEKTFGMWESASFTLTTYEIYTEGNEKMRDNILKYCS